MQAFVTCIEQNNDQPRIIRKTQFRSSFNDTHREKLCFIQFSIIVGSLLLTFFICLHDQLSSIMHSIITC